MNYMNIYLNIVLGNDKIEAKIIYIYNYIYYQYAK